LFDFETLRTKGPDGTRIPLDSLGMRIDHEVETIAATEVQDAVCFWNFPQSELDQMGPDPLEQWIRYFADEFLLDGVGWTHGLLSALLDRFLRYRAILDGE